MKRAASILALALVLAACNQKQNAASSEAAGTPAAQPVVSASATPSLTPEELGQIGAQIRKEPGRATEILSGRGLTPESFEQMIRATTQDPEASKRYAAAYKKAGA